MSAPTPSVIKTALSVAGLELSVVDKRSTNEGVEPCVALARAIAALSTDFSEAERRVLAFVEQRESLDVYRLEASKRYGIPYDQVSPMQRNAVKIEWWKNYNGRRK